jgi:hypothetical protein
MFYTLCCSIGVLMSYRVHLFCMKIGFDASLNEA